MLFRSRKETITQLLFAARSKLRSSDVMDEFSEIKACVEYENEEPVYKTFRGWDSSTVGISAFEDLPIQAQEYINFIEDFVGCRISYVSTGPSRNQTIHR